MWAVLKVKIKHGKGWTALRTKGSIITKYEIE
jgi:hypothetical protein